LKNIGNPKLLIRINAVNVITGKRSSNPKKVTTRSNIRFIASVINMIYINISNSFSKFIF